MKKRTKRGLIVGFPDRLVGAIEISSATHKSRIISLLHNMLYLLRKIVNTWDNLLFNEEKSEIYRRNL